jgi:glutamate-1-semialdehyde 2,1-aminomutase
MQTSATQMESKNKQLFDRAQRFIPGGVNSPVRAFRAVGGTPVFMHSGKGAYLFDVDGRRYIDFISSWGALLLGHAYPPQVQAIQECAARSTSFGTPTELEVQMAERIVSMVPQVELVRMVNSGTEACMSALRLARGYTGRNKIIKFEGHYHGHADPFLVKAGSGLATLDIQEVPGVTAGAVRDTLLAPFNDLPAVESLVAGHSGELAAIILEPVAGNMGCVLPEQGYLGGLRRICNREGIVLLFDEVMTGFRLAPGGAQELFGIDADLVTFGKVIGGGMPVGAFGGKRAIMECVAPLGKVYQAGTLSGNPIAMASGLSVLTELAQNPDHYHSLEEKTVFLKNGLREVFQAWGGPFVINQLGSMISLHFIDRPVRDLSSSAAADAARFARFFHGMLARGIYLPPSAFESWFLNDALTFADLEETIEAARQTLRGLD